MKSWKVVKPKQNGQEKEKEQKSCNKFRCIAFFVAIVAIIYTGAVSGIFEPLAAAIYSHPAIKPVVTNEYFLLIKRIIQLFILRMQVLIIEAIAISQVILYKIFTGICAVVEKIPGLEHIRAMAKDCKYCNYAEKAIRKAKGQAKNILCYVHDKIKTLNRKE